LSLILGLKFQWKCGYHLDDYYLAYSQFLSPSTKMGQPTESELETKIQQIIDEGDFSQLTFRIIFTNLQKYFDCDLDEKKKFIRQTINSIIEKSSEQDQIENQQDNNHQDDSHTSTETSTPRSNSTPSKKRKTREEKKNGNANNEENTKEDEPVEYMEVSEKDVQLQQLLFEAAKFGASLDTTRTRTRQSPKKKILKKQKKGHPSEGNETNEGDGEVPAKKKKNSGLAKPVFLSPQLADFLGGEEKLPRTEVVKKLHSYIKENNLQDPKDKRKIKFDDKLQEVFKCKSTDFFKLNRLLSKHIKTADEVV